MGCATIVLLYTYTESVEKKYDEGKKEMKENEELHEAHVPRANINVK